jgi:hypothetical protein
MLGGGVRTRRIGNRHARSYSISPKLLTSTLEVHRGFIHQVHANGGVVWVPEVTSREHVDVLCSPFANGTRTTFSLGVMDPSDVLVFVDGNPQFSGFTVHTAANLLPGTTALPTTDSSYVLNGAEANQGGFGCSGMTSLRVTPTAGGACYWYVPSAQSNGAPVTAGAIYTQLIAVFETKSSPRTFTPTIKWYDSTPSLVSTTTGSASVAVYGAWTIYAVSGTCPATAVWASSQVTEPGADTDPWFVDCISVAPGDYDVWHLPSQSPGVVEFDVAPAAGAVITASSTGKAITRCVLTPDSQWSISEGGNAKVRPLVAIESPEV